MSLLCSQQVVVGPAGVSRSKVSYLETFPLSFSQLPSGVGVSGGPELLGVVARLISQLDSQGASAVVSGLVGGC